ncbi:hypothetical protein HanRHA438_Chr05g0233891 [Helianthus annuus]|nr:hypothetical protein HanRHA438_Chr05g0233891 [Helianthus annuus]
MFFKNRAPCSSSPHAPITPHEIPKPAASPLMVLVTLPPAIVFTGGRSFGEDKIWVSTSFSISFNSSAATYQKRSKTNM